MKLISLLITPMGGAFRLAAIETHLLPAMRLARGTSRLISTSRPIYMEKETSGKNGQSRNDVVDTDGYNLKDLNSNEEKVRFDEFKKYIESNSYYEKYKARIVAAQKDSPKAFLAMVENVIPLKKKKQAPRETLGSRTAAKKPLGEIIKIDMLQELPKDDIVFIWQEYHKSINSIGAAMSGIMYDNMEGLSQKHNTFILPLPRNGGYEFYLLQYGGESFHFTKLVQYHMYKENSPVCLTLNFYKDLKSLKDVVLIRGEVDVETLTLEEALHLVVQFNYYYAEGSNSRVELLKKFNECPSDFDHATVIEELNQLVHSHGDKLPSLERAAKAKVN